MRTIFDLRPFDAASEHVLVPDTGWIFWALKGDGGNFPVVANRQNEEIDRELSEELLAAFRHRESTAECAHEMGHWLIRRWAQLHP